MIKKLLPLLLALLVIAACRKDSRQSEEQEVRVSIKNCVQKRFGAETVSLCFDSLIQDSRCPANVICIWQGVAQAKFSFTVNNQTQTFTLSTNKGLPGTITDTTIQQYKLLLVNILPYPGTGSGTSMAEVSITR